MEKKYKFTNETKKVGGCVLHRIVAIRDFYNKRLGVIKKGTVGGYIESEENLCHDDGSWVMDDACAYEHARVDRNGIVAENARVYDYAHVGSVTLDGRDPYLMVCGDMDLHFPNNWKIIIGNEIKEVL